MDWQQLQLCFSSARLNRYAQQNSSDPTRAMSAYINNILLTEALFPILNVTEVALRNAIHGKLSQYFNQPNWWDATALQVKDFSRQKDQILKVKNKLSSKTHNEDAIVAALDFGFWTSLFNASLQNILWQPLRLIFKTCPKHLRQRQRISANLNQIRTLRNRAFHHEPLLWLSPSLMKQHHTALTLLSWLYTKIYQTGSAPMIAY